MFQSQDTQFDGYLVDCFIKAYIDKFGSEINASAESIEKY